MNRRVLFTAARHGGFDISRFMLNSANMRTFLPMIASNTIEQEKDVVANG